MGGSKTALMLALICALIASVIVYRIVQEKSKPQLVAIPKTTVVYAKTAISARTTISAEQLELRQIPKEAVGTDSALALQDVIGLITKSEILPGEQLNLNRLVRKGDPVGLSFLIPSGMRAITIAVNEVVGVAGFIKPGERVDIIETLESGSSGSISWTVLQDVEVLAVSQDMVSPARDVKVGLASKQADPKVGTSVTIAVTPLQAQKVALAGEKGVLRLTLRPVLKEAELLIPPVREYNLLPSYPSSSSTQSQKRIEIISGSKSQIITVY